ncbi:Rho GTPase-activating protein 11A [Armadillidium vulgare]|nr:Rho GTPase-activating protein 11A [Armadillidium vulgare]
MHEGDENAIEIIKEELQQLGLKFNNLDKEAKKYSSHQNSSKFLGLHSNSKGKYKREKNYAYELQKTPKKNVPKLDMLSAENVSDRHAPGVPKVLIGNRLHFAYKRQVFGCELDKMELCTVSLENGSPVSIPKFVEEASNLIRKNVNTEGLFRKGGSAQRQNEIKLLLNKGYILPNTVHPIDVACLLKHFFRELPTPLISVPIHILMTRCLNIPEPNRLEALILCKLLLPKRNQNLLAYVLELISFVAASSNINLMDTHNLAIIFAPTLMPDMKTGGKTFTNECKVTSDIKIMELLIEGSSLKCLYSRKLIFMLENRRFQPLENLDEYLSSEYKSKKKRRSNSLENLNQAQSSVCNSKKIRRSNSLNSTLSEEIGVNPDIESRKKEKLCKRNSDGLHSLHCSDRVTLTLESSRPKKKYKIEANSARTDSVPIAELFPDDDQSNQIFQVLCRWSWNYLHNSVDLHPFIYRSKKVAAIKFSFPSYLANLLCIDIKITLIVLLNLENLESELALLMVLKEQNSSKINRHYSFRERRKEKISSISEKKVPLKVLSCNSLKLSTKSNSPHYLVVNATPKRMKSCNLPRINSGYRERQRITLDIHHDHAPVGSNVVNLGPMGVPVGAKDDIRKSPLIKSNLPSSFRAQEEEFVENSLKKEEISENCKYSIEPYELHNFKVCSRTRLVSDALEKVENETKELEEQFSLPKEFTSAMSLQKEPHENDHEWISAQNYMKDMDHQDSDTRLLARKVWKQAVYKSLKRTEKSDIESTAFQSTARSFYCSLPI